ncbi:MAG: hypothetical protein J0H55_12820 [Chitinophagaceae bacterium]|nr:hypothetical protein [Chitinophagaceae bacterium]
MRVRKNKIITTQTMTLMNQTKINYDLLQYDKSTRPFSQTYKTFIPIKNNHRWNFYSSFSHNEDPKILFRTNVYNSTLFLIQLLIPGLGATENTTQLSISKTNKQ